LTPVLASCVESLSQTRITGKVKFDNAWQIFAPGVLALTHFFGVETLCRICKYEYKAPARGEPLHLYVNIEYVDWNGQKCGYASTIKIISPFKGFKHVKDLPVYALSFNDDPDTKKQEILERGRRFEALRGYHHLTCKGNARKLIFDVDGAPKLKPVRTYLFIYSIY
jgi:hypothetical protein